MDVLYRFQEVCFAWDDQKAAENVEKHGVTFEEAAEVVFDPFYRVGDAPVEEESRSYVLGYSFAQRMLLVLFVERSAFTRIISARPATRAERKQYEEL
jgi:uncharacterized DUF497 family protein